MFTLRTLAVGLAGLAAIGFAMAQTDEEKAFYQLREELAPPDVKAGIARLRSEITLHRYHFTVGVTSKTGADLKQITGYVKPPDFDTQVVKHSLVVQTMIRNERQEETALKLAHPTLTFPWQIIHPFPILPAQYDWRTQNVVTMVKDQGQAGTCWACASCGALESSDLLRNGQYAFVSIQQAVTCSGGGTVNGGSHGPVLDYFVNHGASYGDGGICPYLAIQGTSAQQTAWNALVSTYYATAWDYIHAGGGTATTVELKNAILAHGPVVTAINANYWSSYTGGVMDVPATGSDHVVDIVGWDDSKGAFIVKNSWGHDWGISCGFNKERGYIYVAYGACNIGDAAAWVDAKVPQPTFPWYY